MTAIVTVDRPEERTNSTTNVCKRELEVGFSVSSATRTQTRAFFFWRFQYSCYVFHIDRQRVLLAKERDAEIERSASLGGLGIVGMNIGVGGKTYVSFLFFCTF